MDTNPENKIEIKDKLTFSKKKQKKKFLILIILTFWLFLQNLIRFSN